MWQFKTRNFTVQWLITPDVLSAQSTDAVLLAEWRKDIRAGKLKCFQSEIRVVCNATGIIMGEDYLGGTVLANPANFRDHFGMSAAGHGSYFAQMVKEAISQARERFPAHQAAVAREIRKKQPVLAVRLHSKAKAKVTASA